MNAPAMLEPATGVRERKERRAPGLRATLGPFLHAYRASLLAAAGFSVLQSASELAQPWPLALAVDYAVGRPRLTGAKTVEKTCLEIICLFEGTRRPQTDK